jgi:acetolactate synthase-1/2/3 large subunit
MIAKKPVMLVGNGIKLSHSEEILFEVMNRLQMPVLTTWKTYDLFTEDNKYYCGRPGMIAERGPNFILQECDLLLSLGARLDLCQVAFDHANFAPNAQHIVVDIDGGEIHKLKFEGKIGICKDVGKFLKDLNKGLSKVGFSENSEWLAKCKTTKAQYPLISEVTNNVSLYSFFNQLSKSLNIDDVIVLGSSGSVAEVGAQALKFYNDGHRVISTNSLGSMGFGLSAAIGTAVAINKRVICVDGDGSFAMGIQELQTLKSLDLPIFIFIVNNGGYVSIKNSQNNICDGRFLGINEKTGLSLPNYEKFAQAVDIPYEKIYTNEGLLGIRQYLEYARPPLICELFCNPNHQTQPRTMTFKDDKGNLQMSKLENMWPFLENNE